MKQGQVEQDLSRTQTIIEQFEEGRVDYPEVVMAVQEARRNRDEKAEAYARALGEQALFFTYGAKWTNFKGPKGDECTQVDIQGLVVPYREAGYWVDLIESMRTERVKALKLESKQKNGDDNVEANWDIYDELAARYNQIFQQGYRTSKFTLITPDHTAPTERIRFDTALNLADYVGISPSNATDSMPATQQPSAKPAAILPSENLPHDT